MISICVIDNQCVITDCMTAILNKKNIQCGKIHFQGTSVSITFYLFEHYQLPPKVYGGYAHVMEQQ